MLLYEMLTGLPPWYVPILSFVSNAMFRAVCVMLEQCVVRGGGM